MAELNKRTAAVRAIERAVGKIVAEGFDEDSFQLDQRINTLQSNYDRFMVAHDELIATSRPDELNAHITLFDQVEDAYSNAMAILQRTLATKPAAMCTAVPIADDAASLNTAHSATMNLKLERLSIPKFDGTLQNWLAFKDTFTTLVHDRDFPEAYKLGKLRECVQGDAVTLVGGMYSGGYLDVWKALNARYDSPKQLAEIHVARFIGLAPAQQESTSTLLAIVDTIRESLRALTVMKLPVDQWDALAVPIVVSKLPPRTQQAWGMSRTTQDIPKLEDLLNFVEKRAHSLTSEILRWPTKPSTVVTKPSNVGHRINPSHTSSSTTPRLVRSNLAAVAPGNCEICNTNTHRISKCPKLLALAVPDRFQRLKGSNLCFNCLKPGHPTKECPSGNCRTCDGRHHTLLCRNPTVPLPANTPTPVKASPHPSTSTGTTTPHGISGRPPHNFQ